METASEAGRRGPAMPSHTGPVTLINSFAVPPGREEAFLALWKDTSAHFSRQPGFLSLRLHRSLSPESEFRFVNVAKWASMEQFGAAHRHPEFHRLVSDPAWREFRSSPVLHEEIVAIGPG